MKNEFIEDLVDALLVNGRFAFDGMLPIAGGADQDLAYFGDPSTFTNNDPKPLQKLGERIRLNGKEYMYVQYHSAGGTAILVGAPAYLESQANGTYQVTNLTSESQGGTINDVVGVFGNVITELYYGWIQTNGDFTALIDTVGALKGGAMIGAAAVNTTGRIALNGALTNKVIGYAYSDSAANKINVFLIL